MPINAKSHRAAKKVDRDSERVMEALSSFSAKKIEAYRFNSASIRVRVVSDEFKRKTRVEREEMVRSLLDKVPDRIQQDIIMLLLLTPKEHKERMAHMDLLDVEFDYPRRSGL